MVESTFNDLEALDIAITIEQRGEKFYRLAIPLAPDLEVKSMLENLAKQEHEHVATFQALYNEALEKKEDFDDAYLFDPEVAAYLRAMVESSVFPTDAEQQNVLSKLRHITDVFATGIQAEKDSILFYTEMVIHSKYTEAKEAFRRLIQEEKKHLVDLQKKLIEYKDK